MGDELWSGISALRSGIVLKWSMDLELVAVIELIYKILYFISLLLT